MYVVKAALLSTQPSKEKQTANNYFPDFLFPLCDVPGTVTVCIIIVCFSAQGEDPTDVVSYAAFETKMLEIMASRAWDPDPPEVLLRVSLTKT